MNFAQEFCVELFSRGMEIYDRDTQEATNLGGASFRFRRGGLANPDTSGVVVFDEALNAILRKAPCRLFTVDRVRLLEDGSLPPLNENGYPDREMNAFVLYHSLDATDFATKAFVNHVKDTFPQYSEYICTLSELGDQLLGKGVAEIEKNRIVLPDILVRDSLGLHAARLHSMIVFALPSGSEKNGAVWGYVQTNVPDQEVDALNAIPTMVL